MTHKITSLSTLYQKPEITTQRTQLVNKQSEEIVQPSVRRVIKHQERTDTLGLDYKSVNVVRKPQETNIFEKPSKYDQKPQIRENKLFAGNIFQDPDTRPKLYKAIVPVDTVSKFVDSWGAEKISVKKPTAQKNAEQNKEIYMPYDKNFGWKDAPKLDNMYQDDKSKPGKIFHNPK